MFCALWVFIVDIVHVGSLNRLYIIQLFLNQVLKKCNNFLEVWWFLCHLLGAGAAKRIEKSYFGPSPPNSSACFASCWIQGYCPKPKLFFWTCGCLYVTFSIQCWCHPKNSLRRLIVRCHPLLMECTHLVLLKICLFTFFS